MSDDLSEDSGSGEPAPPRRSQSADTLPTDREEACHHAEAPASIEEEHTPVDEDEDGDARAADDLRRGLPSAEPTTPQRFPRARNIQTTRGEASHDRKIREVVEDNHAGEEENDDARAPHEATTHRSNNEPPRVSGGSHDSTYGSSPSASPELIGDPSSSNSRLSASVGTGPRGSQGGGGGQEEPAQHTDRDPASEGVAAPRKLPLSEAHTSAVVVLTDLLKRSDPANADDQKAISVLFKSRPELQDLLDAYNVLFTAGNDACLPAFLGGYRLDQLDELGVLEAVHTKIGEVIRDFEETTERSPSRHDLRHEPINARFNNRQNRHDYAIKYEFNSTYKECAAILDSWLRRIDAATDSEGRRKMDLPGLVHLVRSGSHGANNDICMVAQMFLYVNKRCAADSGWTCDLVTNRQRAQPGVVTMVSMFYPNAKAGKDVTSPDLCPTSEGGAAQKDSLTISTHGNGANIMHHTITSADGTSSPRNRNKSGTSAIKQYVGVRGATAFLDDQNIAKLHGYVEGLQLIEDNNRHGAKTLTKRQRELADQCKKQYYDEFKTRGGEEKVDIQSIKREQSELERRQKEIEKILADEEHERQQVEKRRRSDSSLQIADKRRMISANGDAVRLASPFAPVASTPPPRQLPQERSDFAHDQQLNQGRRGPVAGSPPLTTSPLD